MGVDLAVATPVFLDYTFVGLEGLPGPGEERFAGDLLRSPGGGAITAIGAVRLGLSAAVAAYGVAQGVPTATLSRGVAGTAGGTLIVNLPGSSGGARDGMAVLAPVLQHAVSQLRGGDH